MVRAPRLIEFKMHLDNILRHMVWFLGLLYAGVGAGRDDPDGSFPTQDTLWFFEPISIHPRPALF